MDKEHEELQFLGFFGIWRESFKIILKWSEIFLQLGLSLTLPLSFIYMTHVEISHLLLQNLILALNTLVITMNDDTTYETALRVVSMELARYALIQVSYIIFLFVFSLLSTSAVVYTVACIYSSKKVIFKEVILIVPKVWKRLMVTFISSMAIIFVYNFVFGFIAIIIVLTYPMNFQNIGKIMLLGKAILIIYLLGVCYMSVIWQLANTISVLEESYGFKALKRSKVLMKGKMGISVAIFLANNLCVGGALQLYNSFVVVDHSNIGMLRKVGLNIISLLLLSIAILLGLVVHTVFYFVCKSYHNEKIDKSVLVDHLKIYHGEGYILLKPKDIQLMEQV